jgi:hypothetical protein
MRLPHARHMEWKCKMKPGITCLFFGLFLLFGSSASALNYQLYPNYGEIAWNFMRQFARESKTGNLLYTPH